MTRKSFNNYFKELPILVFNDVDDKACAFDKLFSEVVDVPLFPFIPDKDT